MAAPTTMKRITLSLLGISALTLSAYAEDEKGSDKPVPDYTAKNERHASRDTKTSGDDSITPDEARIIAAICRAMDADDSLQMSAKNVKIIAADGKITLQGPVRKTADKTKIDKLAKKEAGKAKVDNQLVVTEAEIN